MEKEENNKNKIYLILIIFIMIIMLSGYVVVDRIIESRKNNEQEIVDNEIKDSDKTDVVELSLDNKTVKRLYNYINNEKIEYSLYLDKNKNISWDSKSIIISKNLNQNLSEYVTIDNEEFDGKYKEIFGEYSNNEIKQSKSCLTTTYIIEEGIYAVNFDCYVNNTNIKYKTFLKNIILNNDDIIINKYYVFLEYEPNEKLYSLYKNDKLTEKNIIVDKIDYSDINNYIYNMDIISYIYKKDSKGNYHLQSVK